MFTPEIIDDTYTNMEVALTRDTEVPDFSGVTKRLKDANGQPIGTANENTILDTGKTQVIALPIKAESYIQLPDVFHFFTNCVPP